MTLTTPITPTVPFTSTTYTLPITPTVLITPTVPPMPVAGAVDGSYAPFVPRHTPKHGEADGL